MTDDPSAARSSSPGRPPESPRGAAGRFAAGIVAVIGVLLLGSVLGSRHARAADRAAAAPTVTAPAVVSVLPAVTVTATVTAAAAAAVQPTDPVGNGCDVDQLIPLITNGRGARKTAPFTTTCALFEVAYTYDCSLLGARGRFVATLERNGDNVGPIADTAGVSGRGVAFLANGTGTFSVRIDTSCRWTIVVVESDQLF